MSLYTENQLSLKSMVADFMQKEIVPIMAEYDRKGEVPMEVVRKGMEMGFHLMEIPEAYGGIGLSFEDYCVLHEEIAAYEADAQAQYEYYGMTEADSRPTDAGEGI